MASEAGAAPDQMPQFFNNLSDKDREEILDFIKRQIVEIIKEDQELRMISEKAARSESVSAALRGVVEKTGEATEEALLNALTLYEVAIDAVKQGQRLALLSKDYRYIREIVGVGHPKLETADHESFAG